MQIETVAMPTRGHTLAVESVPMPGKATKPAKAKKKKSNKPPKLSPLQTAANEYKTAYKQLYGVDARLTFDGTWIRIKGESQGMSLSRLKERTAQLKNRIG